MLLLPAGVDGWTLFVLHVVSIPVGIFAFVNALTHRADAYTAAERMTKASWLGITGGGMVALVLFGPDGFGYIFWIAGLVAVLVYLVDVRPKLIEVQRGSKW